MNDSKYPDDWEKRRYATFKRDGFECQNCGFPGNESRPFELHAHHVKPISEGGSHSVSNLLTLCQPCHTDAHSNPGDGTLVKPVEYKECNVCGAEYTKKKEGSMPGYCSETCFARNEAQKWMNSVDNHERMCSTCYHQFDLNEGVCPNCGNWEPNVERREELGVTNPNLVRMLMRIMSERDVDNL